MPASQPRFRRPRPPTNGTPIAFAPDLDPDRPVFAVARWALPLPPGNHQDRPPHPVRPPLLHPPPVPPPPHPATLPPPPPPPHPSPPPPGTGHAHRPPPHP